MSESKKEQLRLLDDALETAKTDQMIKLTAAFNIMRILKKLNPGDAYYENYLGHLAASGGDFYDTYLLLWEIGARLAPKRILEIGTRTGIGLCQLLSSYLDHSVIERIVSVDPFGDGFLSSNLVRKNLAHLNLPADKVEFMEMKSEEAIPLLTAELPADDLNAGFDLIIVDGDHAKDTAYFDLLGADMLVAPGGIIVFDDIAPAGCDLLDVWERFTRKSEISKNYTLAEPKMQGKGVVWAIRNELPDSEGPAQ